MAKTTFYIYSIRVQTFTSIELVKNTRKETSIGINLTTKFNITIQVLVIEKHEINRRIT